MAFQYAHKERRGTQHSTYALAQDERVCITSTIFVTHNTVSSQQSLQRWSDAEPNETSG